MIRIRRRIRIRIVTLVRRALAELCTIPVLLILNLLAPNFIVAAIFAYTVVTFRVRSSRAEMYIGLCLSVPCRIPTLLHGLGCNFGEWYGVPSSCALLGGFAIGAGFRCCDNIARTRNVSECLYSLYACFNSVNVRTILSVCTFKRVQARIPAASSKCEQAKCGEGDLIKIGARTPDCEAAAFDAAPVTLYAINYDQPSLPCVILLHV